MVEAVVEKRLRKKEWRRGCRRRSGEAVAEEVEEKGLQKKEWGRGCRRRSGEGVAEEGKEKGLQKNERRRGCKRRRGEVIAEVGEEITYWKRGVWGQKVQRIEIYDSLMCEPVQHVLFKSGEGRHT